jgi:lipoate-protein ligase A
MQTTIRLLPFANADGPGNMAADEVLVRAAANGTASLRFYGWTTATLSLGYFQSASVRLSDPLLAALPFVRRPSGGATLVHHHELTYCLALPPGAPWQSGEAWMPRMHRIITSALGELGLTGKVQAVNANPIKHGDVLCFQQYTPGDLLSLGKKVVGSAQRKFHQALMQHGSILLAQSEYTPSLPGLRETCGVSLTMEQVQTAVLSTFARDTGWRYYTEAWNVKECELIQELIVEKYAAAAWNEKR